MESLKLDFWINNKQVWCSIDDVENEDQSFNINYYSEYPKYYPDSLIVTPVGLPLFANTIDIDSLKKGFKSIYKISSEIYEA